LDHEEDREDVDAALAPLFHDGTIGQAVARLTSGKEATVWCCEAGPALEGQAGGLVAVKVYRSEHDRSFRGHATYLDSSRIPGRRVRLAIDKRTRAGREMMFGIWVEQEWEALRDLWADGVSVPRPLRRAGHAIAMEYLGDEDGPAPLLRQVRLDRATTRRVLLGLLDEVERMLGLHRVHGDLSPYNVLWWQDRARIIDLPQTVDPRFEPQARAMLERDVTRLTDWAARSGVEHDPMRHCRRLWDRFRRGEVG
jgi:RIO kinase 1